MNQTKSKLIGLLWIACAFLLTAAFVLGLPFFAKAIPWSYEKKLANFVGELPQLEVCKNTVGKAEFQKLISRIYPVLEADTQVPITIQVVQGEEINAFASLGAKIYVYEGLIKQAQSAEELAGVLAHEIEHVRLRHIIQGVLVRVLTLEAIDLAMGNTGSVDPKLLNMILNMRFSREQESEADLQGLRRLQQAKIDVAGFRRFFEREENQSTIPAILSDHPSPQNRAELTQQYAGSPIVPILEPGEWRAIKSLCHRPPTKIR